MTKTEINDFLKQYATSNLVAFSIVSNNTNYNSITTDGNYEIVSSESAATMINCPTVRPHRLFVMSETDSIISYNQIIITDNNGIYYRFKESSDWSSWEQIDSDAFVAGKVQILNKLNELVNEANDLNSSNLLLMLRDPARTQYGITCTNNRDGSLTFSGTATGNAIFSYLTKENDDLPSFITPGESYYFKFHIENYGMRLVFYCYDENGDYITGFNAYGRDAYFKVPEETARIRFRFEVESGTTINETIHPYMLNTLSNKGLEEKIVSHEENGIITGEGNPIVLKGTTGEDRLVSLSASGVSDSSILNVSGKNIYWINTSEMSHRVANGVDYKFYSDGRLEITSEGATGSSLSSGNNFGDEYAKVNGIDYWHNFKFKFKEDTVVAISGNWSVHQTSKYKVHMQVSDGETLYYVGENGLILNAIGEKEYAIRWTVSEGWSGQITFHPQIEIGEKITGWERFTGGKFVYGDISDLPYSKRETTTIYTDDNGTLSVSVNAMKTKEKTIYNKETVDILKNITVGKEPIKHRPMVTFIDDDTASIELVERYKNALDAKNVVGNYAVRTKKLDDVAGLSDKLLEYEQEGFGCIYHCYWQSGDSTRYWEFTDPSYDQDLIKDNFMHGLRSMAEYGFSNYKFWVTPYGVNDKFIQDLAKKHGMNCLFTLSTYNHGIVTRNGNVSRWSIPRLILSADTDIDRLKENIDALAETDGWMTIVTHANEWGDDPDAEDSMDNILKEVVQYILDKDIDIKTVPEAFEEMRTSFMLHDLFN